MSGSAISRPERPGATAPAAPVAVDQLIGVEETLLITLWARADETRRRDAAVRDPEAEAILRRLDGADVNRFRRAWKTRIGVAVRTRCIDHRAACFLRAHPDATIVSLGVGLDTRHRRIDNGRAHWYDLDLPRVIEVRRQFIEPTDRHHLLAASLLDDDWIDRIRADAAGRPDPRILIIAEGVLMFIDRPAVEALVRRLGRAFPGGEMIFDVIGGLMVRFPWLHDTLPHTNTRFRWGLRRLDDVRAWSDDIAHLTTFPMLDHQPRRWRWMRWLRHIPALRRQFAVLHLEFKARALRSDRC